MRTPKKSLYLGLVVDVHSDLADLAAAEGRSLSNMAGRLLREAIDRRRQAIKEPDQRTA